MRTAPAAEVAAALHAGAFDDEDGAARGSAGEVDVVTYEFENIADRAARRARRADAAPSAGRGARDRAGPARPRRNSSSGHGGRPAPFAPVDDRAGLDAALAAIGTPAILKTRRFGYDGKGQARIERRATRDAAWEAVRGAPSVLEGFVALRRRILDPALPRRRRRDRRSGTRRATATRAASSVAPSVPAGAGARRGDRRGRGAGPPDRRRARPCRHAGARIFRASAARRCSTRWRRASTIAATGRSKAR